MTLTACQKDEVSPSAGATSQTITVSIPQGVQTRAAAADFGDGSQIDRCLLQIYRNGQPYGEQQTATVTVYYHEDNTREMTREERADFLADQKGYGQRYLQLIIQEKRRLKRKRDGVE